MKNGSYGTNESQRIKALQSYNILDTHVQQDYDDIVELASQICEVPIAMINLIDENRQWTKSKKGIRENEIPRSLSFCAEAILSEELTIVKDTLEDQRFSDKPYVVAKPFIRFYTAVPLSTKEGYRIGTLAVFDQKPRELSSSQLSSLRILGKQIMTLLDLRLNIQKREAAEEKLEKNNEELNAKVKAKTSEITDVFERVSDAFIAVDKAGHITYSNEKAKAIFTKPPDIVVDQSLWDIFPKEVSLLLSNLTHEAMASQHSQSQQFYYEPDGLWFESRIHPSPNGLSIYLRDITIGKLAEQKQNADKYFSDAIINGLPGIFYLFDTNLKFLRWNENFQTISGYSANEIKQMSPLEFFDNEDKPRIIKAIETVYEKGTTDIEANFLIKSGQKTPYFFTGKFETVEGTPCIMGLGIDITERREAEKNYRDIFENSLEGIYQSTPNGKFITANPAMAKILGYNSPEELISSMTDIENQLYENPKDRLKLQHLLKTKSQVNAFELKVRKMNGDVIWAHLNIRTVKDEQGNTLHFEGILEDITKRKVAETKLKQQFEELQKTNFELDKFVYSVSHDLRAPLASILGLINVAQLEKPSTNQNQYWEMVRSSIIKLEGFIKDILDYSNNARREIKAQKIDFNKIMDEVQENFSYLSGFEQLSATIEINEEVQFYSDETRIKIILNNLFSNAIKYQDIYKKQSYFKLKVNITDLQAHINVEDNGIGIEDFHLDKVFNMFYRASDNSKGSGLGLYITNETVLKLDGTIEIQSKMGEGTSFDILLPSRAGKSISKSE